jgi:hypothetical protein
MYCSWWIARGLVKTSLGVRKSRVLRHGQGMAQYCEICLEFTQVPRVNNEETPLVFLEGGRENCLFSNFTCKKLGSHLSLTTISLNREFKLWFFSGKGEWENNRGGQLRISPKLMSVS